ncbi:MAG: WGR domain-containing protein [Rhizobiales bacterium]|nr:WGR domain-containing protein [Hyphomicrobiales bacterium]
MDTRTLLLQRIEPAADMARYYGILIEQRLFGDVALVRRWGWIGRQVARLIELHQDRAAALAAFGEFASAKRRRGYVEAGPTSSS